MAFLAFALMAFAGVAGVILLVRRLRPGAPWDERLAAVLFPVLAAYCLMVQGQLVALGPMDLWNGFRVVPSMSLWNGESFYPTTSDGPVMPNVYGPIGPFFYLPAAVLGWDPTSAIMIGVLLTTVIVLGAVAAFLAGLAWVGRRSGNPEGQAPVVPWVWAVGGFVLVYAGMLQSDIGQQNLGNVHVDAPCLGFGLLACAALFPWREGGLTDRQVIVAGVLGALCVWSKQTGVGILAGLFFYLIGAWGWRPAALFAGTIAAVSAAFFVVFGLILGFDGMILNMFTVPGKHRLRMSLVKGVTDLWPRFAWMLVAGIFLLVLTRGTAKGWRDWLRSDPWVTAWAAALLLAPLSLLGYLKVGGWVNTVFSYFYGMVGIAGAMMWVSSWSVNRPLQLAMRWTMMVAAVSLLTTTRVQPQWQMYFDDRVNFGANTQQLAFTVVEKYPGKFYFPSVPLAHYMAEGALYHSDAGPMLDRKEAKMPLTQDHFRKHIPTNFDYYVLSNGFNWDIFFRDAYLPEFKHEVPGIQIGGFTVLSDRPAGN